MENFNKASATIKSWAEDDRPREKLMHKGPDSLSNSELLAILISSGYKEKTAVDIAKEILALADNDLNYLGKLSLQDLKKVKGIGEARAITIVAAMELGRRRQMGSDNELKEVNIINTSKSIARYLQIKLQDMDHEVFAVIYLNTGNRVKKFEIISRGGISGTVADPRIILRKALEMNSTSIILCHNHPSGSLKPSREDQLLTQKIVQAASFMDIRILDHLIVSHEGYYSFADEGNL